jgi:5,6-dimethylbenzimidazole synthase
MASDSNIFALSLRRGLYETIFRRRDMREFLPDSIPGDKLARVLIAAHHAASVGFTQPWDFILVSDRERRRRVKAVFEQARLRNADQFSGDRREKFLSLKLEGILDAPLNIIVTCDPDRFGPAVLGRVGGRDVEIFSTCLAVENLWLAARAEGLGVGWVSILDNDALGKIFSLPANILPIAYLCMGYVRNFPERPVLESEGWLNRLPPQNLIHFDDWTEDCSRRPAFCELLADSAIWREIFPGEKITDPSEKDKPA